MSIELTKWLVICEQMARDRLQRIQFQRHLKFLHFLAAEFNVFNEFRFSPKSFVRGRSAVFSL